MREFVFVSTAAILMILGCSSDPTNIDAGAMGDASGNDSRVDGAGPGGDAAAGDARVDGSSPGADSGPRPDAGPSRCMPACGAGEVCVAGSCVASITGVAEIDSVLLGDDTRFDTEILRVQNPDMTWSPSSIYKWRDFVQAVATSYATGIGEQVLWLGDEGMAGPARAQYALVNLAAFLAQSMKESIKYDACDENNWDNTSNYAISNSCGQLGQNYANYDCDMACPRAPNMIQSASTNARWYGAPGPMFCAPDRILMEAGLMTTAGMTGHWSHTSDCWPYPATEPGFTPADVPAYSRPDCEVYTGQKGGAWVWDGSGGSVEGCCWWGRGVIQTTGRCNFGTLNHFLGTSHLDPAVHPGPSTVLYPEVNFCENPGVICNDPEYPELKWIAGLFYWMSSVQDYDERGWQYRTALRAYVDGGMTDDAFIDSVSGIVNRGCHDPPCDTGALDGGAERRENFDSVLRVMGVR